jgi:hypothetical protein
VKQISEKEHESCIAFYKLDDCNCENYRKALEEIHRMGYLKSNGWHQFAVIADEALKEVAK